MTGFFELLTAIVYVLLTLPFVLFGVLIAGLSGPGVLCLLLRHLGGGVRVIAPPALALVVVLLLIEGAAPLTDNNGATRPDMALLTAVQVALPVALWCLVASPQWHSVNRAAYLLPVRAGLAALPCAALVILYQMLFYISQRPVGGHDVVATLLLASLGLHSLWMARLALARHETWSLRAPRSTWILLLLVVGFILAAPLPGFIWTWQSEGNSIYGHYHALATEY